MNDSQLVGATEAARALGISKSFLYRLAAQKNGVPSYKVGIRGVRFDIGEVREALRRPITPEKAVQR